MKYAVIIPDGAADEPQQALGGRTPLQAAHLPGMDEIARLGCCGLANHVPAELPSGSDVGSMSLLGYDPLRYHTGRAPIEAAAQGIPLQEGDWAIRCNLVTICDGFMRSFTAGQIPTETSRAILQLLQQFLTTPTPWQYYAGVSYRNLLIYRGVDGSTVFDQSTQTTPPHDIPDQPIAPYLPTGAGASLLREQMELSQQACRVCQENVDRTDRGELAATQTWLWGLGRKPDLPSFLSRFGIRGAVITAVDLLRGLGKLLGWDVIEVPGATGYLDTDFAAKGRYAIQTLRNGHDLIVVHVEATDEASHEGKAHEKVWALEQIDRHIVCPLLDYLRSYGNYRMLICPDHPTFLRTRTHSHGFVPFAACGTGIAVDDALSYDETTGAHGSLKFTAGHELMEWFLQS